MGDGHDRRRNDMDDREIALLDDSLRAMQAACLADPYPTAEQRRANLRALVAMMIRYRMEIREALKQDFATHPDVISDLVEVVGVVGRARSAIADLDDWMAPESRHADPAMFGTGRAYVQYQPKGVIGLIVPWNFPIELSCGPLSDMLAAGNRVIIKPSELAPASSALLRRMIAETFPSDLVTVIEGGVALSQAFCTCKWDHLLYTGSTHVGREVMRAAAENLVPVTLELGGKCPAVLTRSGMTAKSVGSILGMKAMKNGQVCVSVDHVMVPAGEKARFVELAQAHMRDVMPGFFASDGVTGLINDRHYARVIDLIDDARAGGAQVISLAEDTPSDPAARRIPLHLVLDAAPDARVMTDEVFGPVLPVVEYDGVDDAIARINAGDRPLGIYVYGDNQGEIDRIVARTASGGVTVNGAALHGALSTLGFGGIGASGMGRHHGHDGFREFSNPRSVFVRGENDMTDTLYAPYGAVAADLIEAALAEPAASREMSA
ncbi:MAG: aldehyde dehydrogenase family protein [Sphingobium sp.]